METMTYLPRMTFDPQTGLIPAIVLDAATGTVLMLGYMNAESVAKTYETGLVTFYSRSRQTLWTKGETSGNTFALVDIREDCDGDALLVLANPVGPACHNGTTSCFHPYEGLDLAFLAQLQTLLESRRREMPPGSYTSTMFAKGVDKLAQKVGEEAVETVIAAKNDNAELIYEASDLVFHLMMLLTEKGLRIEDVARELRRRSVKM
jgi:phosphoribosyl-ATP pyrophosphohydrolase/phosphoribosyl-AMP cyclohydrolase